MASLIVPVCITVLVTSLVWGQETDCYKNRRDQASISTTTHYHEVLPGSEISIQCTVCKYRHSKVQVSWSLAGRKLQQSSRVHTYQKHPDMYILMVRQATPRDMGNYSCEVEDMDGNVMDSEIISVEQLPPPPTFPPQQDRINSSSQLLTWSGGSVLPIIQYLLEFRLSPVSGVGEDWVNLVIPYQTSPQSYLLRGLSAGTRYQARVRTKTRNGISYYSNILEFTTYSPWTTIPTTTRPNTIFSLPQTRDENQKETRRTSSAKELSSFSSGAGRISYDGLGYLLVISLSYLAI